MSNDKDFYEAKFPFIDENLFLIASVNKKTGRQKLKIQKVNSNSKRIEFENGLDCIHTAITTISYKKFSESFESEEDNENFKKEMINARSTERLTLVDLSPEEHFFALKSWTEGIAEAGLDALNLQSDIENAAHFQYPIANFLLKALMRINFDYIGIFFENIIKSCKYEGIYHKSSLRANFNMILQVIVSYLDNNSDSAKVLEILNNIMELDSEFLFQNFADEDYRVRQVIAVYPNSTKFEEYKKLFTDEDARVRKSVAINPNAAEFEEYKKLFTDEDVRVRQVIAANPNATKFEEYKKFFVDDDAKVRQFLAANPNAIKFEEYKILFNDEDAKVRQILAANPNATKFEEYKKFFDDKWEIRRAIVKNPNATKFEEYKKLIPDEFAVNKIFAAKNPNATKFGEYKLLFYDEEGEARYCAAKNPSATRFEEYRDLFNDKYYGIKTAIASNPNAVKFEEYKILMHDNDILVRQAVARNPNAKKLLV